MSTFYAFHSGSPLKCRVLEGVAEMDYHMYEPGRYVTVVTFSKKKKSMKAVLSELKEMSDVYGTGQIAKVKKADGKNMRVVHVMQGIRSAACVSEYAHHCWQVSVYVLWCLYFPDY